MEGEIPVNFQSDKMNSLLETASEKYKIAPEKYNKYNVKRGLRNSDGTGVLAGLTSIGEVRGYIIDNGEKVPVPGNLFYRGINLMDLVRGAAKEDRFGFEETAFLLLFGVLPDKKTLETFCEILGDLRTLPNNFAEDMILKAPSNDIMNKLARCVLASYSYDDTADATDIANLFRQSIGLIAKLPTMMAYAYQAKRHYYDKLSLFLHSPKKEYSTAQNILHLIRPDNQFSDVEAKTLDLLLMIHAEHGGGNNSAFACRVVSSSGTDTYSAIAAAIGSLKGPKHGGANAKVMAMMDGFKENVSNWNDKDEVAAYIEKIIRKEAGDGSGLIYGMGHAVYTLSDPRAVLLKAKAKELAQLYGCTEEFMLYDNIEQLTPKVFAKVKGDTKVMSANVDLYSGFVYKMLNIPPELYTPLFVIARIVGWCAHRIEEVMTNGRIIRPAYKSLCHHYSYTELENR